jgi:hypothetical protein
LHFSKDELEAQQQDLAQNSSRYLELVRIGAPAEEYSQWFTNSHIGDAPPRGGYLLGYEVTRRVLASYTLEDMIRMSPAELREHAEEQLAAMSNERILLMAAR